MILSWLCNSISKQLRSSLAFMDNANEIWTELRERFSQQNGPRIYELKKALSNLTQEDDSVSIYYSRLKSLWDELSVYDPLPECTCGKLKLLLDRYYRDCAIQFLMGLNESYSNVRDQIMLMEPLPSVKKVFSYILQQERQRSITSSTSSAESISLAARKFSGPYKSTVHSKKERSYCTYCKIGGHDLESCFKAGNAEAPLCNYCHMVGHIAEKCYKINGYPPGHKLHGKGKSTGAYANQASVQRVDDNDVMREKTTATPSATIAPNPSPSTSGISLQSNSDTRNLQEDALADE